jgi:hypothetical protein
MGFLSSLFGVGGSKPRTETNIVQQQLPKEISPFVTEIAEEAQELFKERVAEGYTPYTGQAIAPLTAQQEAAMTGIEGLVGTTRPLQEEALGITRQQAERFTPESAEAYMSPYQRAVTDIEKREAGRQFDVAQQARDAQAAGAGAGSLMGTRSAILEAEAQRNQQQLLADIESRGLQSAYQDAQRAFEAQKARERAMAGDIAATGPAMLASGLQEQGALQTVGEERRDLGQATLDEAYFKFLEERQFPEQTLSDYSAFIYGNPMSKLANTTTTGTMTPYQPSLGQTLLGIGSTLGAAALRNPNVTKMFKGGGYLDRNRGLSGLPMFRRQEAGQVVDEEDEGSVEFIQDIKDLFGPLTGMLEREKEKASERTKLGMEAAPFVRQRIADYFTKPSTDPKAQENIRKLEEARQKKKDFEERIVKEKKDAELLETATESAGDSEGLPGDIVFEAGEEEETITNVSKKTPKDRVNAKRIQGALANQPKEGRIGSLTMQEAEEMVKKDPKAYGIETTEDLLKYTKDYNDKYMTLIKNIYPESQNEFLADALQALGAMFVAENKGEAFNKTFNKLQEAGLKRRDARRVALGKAALDNLKTDKETMEKIRQLPKQRRDAIMALVKERREGRAAEAKISKDIEQAGYYKRKPGSKPTKATPVKKGELERAAEYTKQNTLPKILSRVENDKVFAGKIARILASSSTIADNIADEVGDAFDKPSFKSNFEREYEILRNQNPYIPPSSLYEPAAIKALGLYKENRKTFSTDDVELR